VARNLRDVGRQLDAGEFLAVVPMSIGDAFSRIASGEITDIKTVAGILWLKSVPGFQ
jgi:ADP-ribose pyrophosphatase